MAARGYDLIRWRARRAAELYDGIRIDHLVGLYRTYNRLPDGTAFFLPGDEGAQLRQGEAILEIFKATDGHVLAEDLGTVPDFVRASMARLGVPGTKVLRWERMWEVPGEPFIDPAHYPESSVVMTGTHDTETLAVWWERASPGERWMLFQLPAMQALGFDDPHEPWSDRLRAGLLALAWQARSAELFVPFQDLFGWPDRINTPGTVTGSNWTWRLRWPVDTLGREAECVGVAETLAVLGASAGRGRTPG